MGNNRNQVPIGVVYPHDEIETDAGAVRAFAQGVEALGYSHISAFDHVLGANRASRPDWKGLYDLDTLFHEPFVLFSYMAGATRNIGFMSGIMILPQRQTALVAKQAACLDILCEGRLRLGIGTGWNKVEYDALNVSFAKRGARMEEQVDVLRQLWTNNAVTVDTAQHTIIDAGINPLPMQRPIPIWMGGGGDRPHWGEKANENVIRRIARLADGWLPMWDLARQNMDGVFKPEDRALELLEMCHGFCREYNRDPATLGLEGRFGIPQGTEWDWQNGIKAWQDIGCSHISINSMYDGLTGVDQHLRHLEQFSATFRGA